MKGSSRIRKGDWKDIMEAARREFPMGNRYGVCGFGIDRRAQAGRRTKTVALNAYVLHKLDAPKSPVPAVRAGRAVVCPDVVGMGAEPRAHDSVAKPLTLGLYAGAAIRVGGKIPQYGGIACMLGDDDAGGQAMGGATHFMTAGHLFPPGRANVEVLGGLRGRRPAVVGRLLVNLLDQPYPSMEFPIDAALVRLTPAGARIASVSLGGPKLEDFAPSDEANGIEVKAFLPTAHDYSRPTNTLNGPLDAQMSSPARGAYFVRNVIGTEAAITHRGDSGTILCDADSGAIAIGVCVGQLGSMSVFEPLARALTLFRENTDAVLNFV